MKARFLTALHFLNITGDLGRGDRINDTTFITNNKKVIKEVFQEDFSPIIGHMETKYLLNAEVVIYSNDTIPNGITPRLFLINKLYSLMGFLNTIWLFKDNSINNEISFLFYGESKLDKVDSNFIAVRFSNSLGKEKNTTISRRELKEIRGFFRNRMSVEDFSNDIVTKLSKGAPRISRAFYYVQGARTSSDVAIKISNYCSALEALFATSQAELAHQLSERVAYFLEDDPKKRLATYRNVKNAYSVRSKIVHGAVIKTNKIGELVEISQITDEMLRASLEKIHRDSKLVDLFSGSAEGLDEFMLRRIVGL